MRYLKALGLAAIAALAVMALGATSASATGKICSTAGGGPTCNGGHGAQYTGAITASLIDTTGGGGTQVHAVLTSGFVQVTCTGSHVTGSVTNAAAGTGQITGMTFTGCTNNLNGGACTAKTSASAGNPWHVTATPDAGTSGSGEMHIKNVTGSFTCNIFFANRTCTYQASEATVHAFGSDTTPTLEATGVALTKEEPSDGLCSATGTWEGRYEITSPTSMWIT